MKVGVNWRSLHLMKPDIRTGEITLRGNILGVGGLKEKALAALRYGIKRVIIPYENLKDLEEIPKEQRDKIEFFPVRHISEVLDLALLGAPKSALKSKNRRKGGKPTLVAEV